MSFLAPKNVERSLIEPERMNKVRKLYFYYFRLFSEAIPQLKHFSLQQKKSGKSTEKLQKTWETLFDIKN